MMTTPVFTALKNDDADSISEENADITQMPLLVR